MKSLTSVRILEILAEAVQKVADEAEVPFDARKEILNIEASPDTAMFAAEGAASLVTLIATVTHVEIDIKLEQIPSNILEQN